MQDIFIFRIDRSKILSVKERYNVGTVTRENWLNAIKQDGEGKQNWQARNLFRDFFFTCEYVGDLTAED